MAMPFNPCCSSSMTTVTTSCCISICSAQSWYELQQAQPMNPFDLIQNAIIGATPGVLTNSTNYNNSTWAASTVAIKSGQAPQVSALETTNAQMQVSSTQLVWAILRNDGSGQTALTVFDAIALRDGAVGLLPAVPTQAPITIGSWAQGSAFVVPTVCNGKVYAACENFIGVFFCANEHKVP